MGMVAVGCSDDDNLPDNIFFGLDKDWLTISPDGGSVDIVVYSNYKWEISGTSDWCTPSVKKGKANKDGQTVTFTADVAYDNREATFWFRCADKQIKFVVSQKLKEAIIPNENNTFDIPAEGGDVVIDYQTNVECDIIIPEDAQDWITLAPETRGLVAKSATLQITENTTYSVRTAIVKVVAKNNTELAVEYTINQKQNDAILSKGDTVFNIPSEGGNVVIDYQTNVECDIIIPEDAQDWITLTPETRGLVAKSAQLHVAENTIYSARSAIVKVVAKDNSSIYAEYTINQEQNDAILSKGDTVFNIGGWEQQITIKHKANVDCEVIIPDDAQDWVTIAPATRGLSTYSTILNIAENNSGKERSCVIKVTSQGDNELSAEYTIIQNPRYYLYYTSSNGKIVQPYDSSSFGATILSNTYIDGVGVIEFKAPITKIGYEAFCNCDSLTSVTIPDSITTIGNYAFEDCDSLTSITIGDSVTTIGDYAFRSCSSLTSVTISDSVTTIGNYAFRACSSLTSVTIGDSVTKIGSYAFYECESLTSVTIPDSVTTIGDNAFYYCRSLASVTIGDSVTTIGSYAFYGCKSLTSVTIGDSVTTIGGGAFEYCGRLTSITIPDSVTSIGYNAFWSCIGLKSVTIPDSVTTIGYGAFYNCSGLTSVTIGNCVTSIGSEAFYFCLSLTSVTIPDSVTSIGGHAFYNCSRLTSVYCKATTPPAGGSIMFYDNASGRKIYVPTESVEAYKSASGWSSYADAIVGYNF